MPETHESVAVRPDAERSPKYRVIIQDPAKTEPVVVPITVSDDEAAKATAQHLIKGCAAELWDDLRFIEHYKPPNKVK